MLEAAVETAGNCVKNWRFSFGRRFARLLSKLCSPSFLG